MQDIVRHRAPFLGSFAELVNRRAPRRRWAAWTPRFRPVNFLQVGQERYAQGAHVASF